MPPKGKGRGRGGPRRDDQQPRQPQAGRGDAPRQPQAPPGRGEAPPSRQPQAPPGIGEAPPSRQPQAPSGRGQAPPFRQPQAPPGRDDGPPVRQQQGPPSRAGQPPPGFSQPAPVQEPPAPQRERKPQPVDTVTTLGIELKHKLALTPALPAKPAPGKLGRPIKLITNCIPFQAPSGTVYHYDVEIVSKGHSMTTKQPPPKPPAAEAAAKEEDKDKNKKYRCLSTKKNREIINLLIDTDEKFRGRHPAYDGMKNLYAREPLKIGKELKCNVILEDDDNPGNPDDPRGRRSETFEVIIKPVQKTETQDCAISLDPLHALFAGKVTSVPQEAVMAMETILRHGPCKRATPIGRSFFYPPAPQDIHPLGGGLEIWFGYHQSTRLGQWKPLINIDLTATAFYQKGPVLRYIADFLQIDLRQLQQGGSLKDRDITRISKELKTMRIEVTHLRYRRKYRVIKLTQESANAKMFTATTADGQSVRMSVAQYFAQNYTALRYPHLPCIQVNPEKKGIFIPIEVCELVDGQHCRKKLDDKQTAEMIKFTAKPPKLRFDKIREAIRSAKFNEDPCVREFGMKVSTEPLSLDGRVIEAPNVRYNDDRKVKPRDGSWDMRGNQYLRGADINTWVLLSFSNPRFCGYDALERFAKLLCNIASEQGIEISRPAAIDIIDTRRPNIQNILTQVQKKYNANLVVIVVPGSDKVLYGEVKQVAETMLGLVTQCIKDNNVARKCTPPLVSNLCQKINAKAGGVNNSLTPGETPAIMRKPVIIIGADVTHPGPSVEIKPSIAACVGSLDAYPSRYAVTLSAQTNKNEKKEAIEIILNLKEMVLELLKKFYRHTRGRKPEKIIFYRDGVSEGQFDHVREHEVKSIREACRTLSPDYQPGITFIVVQKRHHVRFMPQDERMGAGKMRNVPPGTTVDNTVVHPLNFDFFLCSHFGLQGTSRPCHYTVLEDDNDFTADDLQKLTYYLCHTYVRCTKSISSPAPVQYAHLAAFRARQHLLTTMDESSASSTSSGSSSYHPLPEAVTRAISIVDGMKDTMYFV
ncbi:protein argonaute-4-like [Argiope bruennichi]|uniref:Protein argonaute-2-like protein n=1 Tax=Argiope bruennichi TaxID=94029 RepID=A0A8T0FGL6_ARGBR|nr:protein argonaute-4-like [Argiope bruennichi]XP_055941018.1 protein argonaute-4-like [Argiope bruennichi]KAF8788013.1 Protein argonaute-2-like protein [Argiope bruennichi]